MTAATPLREGCRYDPVLAKRPTADGCPADPIVTHNMLARVSGLNGFVAGLGRLFKPSGVATPEFPQPSPPDRRDPIRHDLP